MLQHGALMRSFQQWQSAARAEIASRTTTSQSCKQMQLWNKRRVVAAWRSKAAKRLEHRAIISVCIKLMRSRTLHSAYQQWRQWTSDSALAHSKVQHSAQTPVIEAVMHAASRVNASGTTYPRLSK